MITLYLVRHGETVFNHERRIQGHADSPLTELGVKQAKAMADKLADESFTAIYSSDLGRAYATAEIIASRHNMPIGKSELIREGYFGLIQGMSNAEFEEHYPEEYGLWQMDSIKHRPPQAETIESVIERCGRFLNQVRKEHADGDRLLTVLHGGSLKGIICAALNLPVPAFRYLHSANASLSILQLGERPALWLLNDTCHLAVVTAEEEENTGPGK